MKKIIHPWQTIVWVCCIGTAALTSILAIVGPVADESDFFSYYMRLAVGPLLDALVMFFNFFLVASLVYGAFYFFYSAFYIKRDPFQFFSRRFLTDTFWAGLRELWAIITLVLPIVATLLFVSMSMSYINPVNATRLIDIEVLRWDSFLFGSYPFIQWQGLAYPDLFIQAVNFSFMYLPLFLIGFSFYVFFWQRKVFGEMAAVFCLNLVLMIFFWQIFPVMSPHDRFIDNVYELPVPSAIEEQLASNYHPHPLIQQFLDQMRDNKNRSLNGTMPTSTLPSAHVAWATLLVYYAYRTRKWSLVLFLPVAIFSSIGTFLFAQHYVVDVPAGVAVLALSVFLVRLADRASLPQTRFI